MTQRFIEAAMVRRLGMSEGGLERLEAANTAATDWRATCHKCGEQLRGSMEQLMEHYCG